MACAYIEGTLKPSCVGLFLLKLLFQAVAALLRRLALGRGLGTLGLQHGTLVSSISSRSLHSRTLHAHTSDLFVEASHLSLQIGLDLLHLHGT